MATYISVAFATFFVGAAFGLACIWIMLGFMPVVVPAVSQADALTLYIILVSVLACAFLVTMAARSIVIAAWQVKRDSMQTTPQHQKLIAAVDAFVHGNGLMLAFASVIVPPYIGALILISPWMGLIAMGAIVAAFKGATGATSARVLLRSLPQGDMVRVWPKGIGRAAVLSCLAAYLLVVAWQRTQDGVDAARRVHFDRLNIVENDIARVHQLAPAIALLYQNRELTERDLVASESNALSRGVGSVASVSSARIRAIEASIAVVRATADAADTMARLDRERLDVATKLKALNSIAPALHP